MYLHVQLCSIVDATGSADVSAHRILWMDSKVEGNRLGPNVIPDDLIERLLYVTPTYSSSLPLFTLLPSISSSLPLLALLPSMSSSPLPYACLPYSLSISSSLTYCTTFSPLWHSALIVVRSLSHDQESDRRSAVLGPRSVHPVYVPTAAAHRDSDRGQTPSTQLHESHRQVIAAILLRRNRSTLSRSPPWQRGDVPLQRARQTDWQAKRGGTEVRSGRIYGACKSLVPSARKDQRSNRQETSLPGHGRSDRHHKRPIQVCSS